MAFRRLTGFFVLPFLSGLGSGVHACNDQNHDPGNTCFCEGPTLVFWSKPEEKRILYICPKCHWGLELSAGDPAPVSCAKCNYAPLLLRYRSRDLWVD